MPEFRFALASLPTRKSVVLHVEHEPDVETEVDSRTACGKTTDNFWIRLRPLVCSELVDDVSGRPLVTLSLCDRCLKRDGVDGWLRGALGWDDSLVSSDENGETYRWSDDDGNQTCVVHTTDVVVNADPAEAAQVDMFGEGIDDGGTDAE